MQSTTGPDMNSLMYDINQYTDDECLQILKLEHQPNVRTIEDVDDATLEKSILQHQQQYQDSRSKKGQQLYRFFSDMYNRFFETSDSDKTSGYDTDATETTTSTT